MNVVRVKPGCRFDGLAPGGIRILGALDTVARAVGLDLVISCGTEGHAPGDPHTLGDAVDVSVHALNVDQVIVVRTQLLALLGPHFTVLYERPDHPTEPRLAAIAYVNPAATAPHLHIQVKRGETYPPSVAVPGTAAV